MFECVEVPSLLDDDFLAVRDAVLRSQQFAGGSADQEINYNSSSRLYIPNASSRRLGSWVAVTNVYRELDEASPDITIEVEMKECMQKLQGISFLHAIYDYN